MSSVYQKIVNRFLAEERLRAAALRSGFANVHFVYEPIAATLSYESDLRKGEEKLVLMGDFGGGTSDFVVMRLRGGKRDSREDREKDILATGGVYIAGDAFDASIMWHELAKHFGRDTKIRGSLPDQILELPIWLPMTLCEWHMIPQLRDKKTLQIIHSLRGVSDEDQKAVKNLHTLIIENLGYMLFRAIEKVKRELSDRESSIIEFSEKGIVIREEITRDAFETLAEDKFQKIEVCVDDTVSRAGISLQDVDTVLLTGGSSFIPRVRRIFLDRFGEGKILPVDAFTSVAYGLGLSAMKY
ncbi:MAG: Hsp70 family protein [Candidatus Moraniibacteriota bacterium]|nr:MAG: Hsp70 family protein [Candidatus Moranbacteria bacterium]